MAKSNIYMKDITTSALADGTEDLSNIYDIEITTLDGTNTVVLCWDVATASATEKITLGANVNDSDEESYKIKSPVGCKGGTLYYKASAGTPIIRISGRRL